MQIKLCFLSFSCTWASILCNVKIWPHLLSSMEAYLYSGPSLAKWKTNIPLVNQPLCVYNKVMMGISQTQIKGGHSYFTKQCCGFVWEHWKVYFIHLQCFWGSWGWWARAKRVQNPKVHDKGHRAVIFFERVGSTWVTIWTRGCWHHIQVLICFQSDSSQTLL